MELTSQKMGHTCLLELVESGIIFEDKLEVATTWLGYSP
jgi:hypothetical protein